MALNVSCSRFPPLLRNSFVENRAIIISVSVQFLAYTTMSSGPTFPWTMKVIRDRTMGEVRTVLSRLGGLAQMCCNSTQTSVKREQRLKFSRSLENGSSAPSVLAQVGVVVGHDWILTFASAHIEDFQAL